MLESEVIHSTIHRGQHVVLVVDDNPATRYATARVLRAAGFKTAEASSGFEALALTETGVAAVVLDINLPDIDGFEVCRRLRDDYATEKVPVVHLSAEFVQDRDKEEGLQAGADAYLVHPVEPAVLIATLQALIRARTAEDQLRRSELRFRAIYDQALSGIVLVDAEGRVADANPAMQKMLGRSFEGLKGKRLSEFAAPGWAETVSQRTEGKPDAQGQVRPWHGQLALLDAHGSTVYIDWSLSEHVEPGLRIGVAIDASERWHLEQNRRDVLDREQAARVAAERHNRTKDDFIAVLSHELRTPLNAIVGWVAIMMRRNPTPEAIKGLEAIDRNVKTQARIISDILDVSRINSGKMRLEREYTDPAELVLTSLNALRISRDQRKLVFETDVEQAREKAWLDPARFQQMIWNLVSNAIKFSNEGGTILVSLRREGPRLFLSVQDFGVGIAPDFLPLLFDRFTQSDSPGNRRHGGLGLGLSIVQHLAELHRGSVTAQSEGLGRGTTLRVELEVVPRPEDLRASIELREARDSLQTLLNSDETAQTDAHPLQGLDILVVEDDPDAREMLSLVLGDRGAKVRLAKNHDDAIDAVQKAMPDVLISDIGLPGQDGYAVIRSVRAMEPKNVTPGRRLPAVALTAFSRADDRFRALDAGFDEHLTKPLRPHALVSAIQALVLSRAG